MKIIKLLSKRIVITFAAVLILAAGICVVGGGEMTDNEPEIIDPTTVLNKSIKYYEKEGLKYRPEFL